MHFNLVSFHCTLNLSVAIHRQSKGAIRSSLDILCDSVQSLNPPDSYTQICASLKWPYWLIYRISLSELKTIKSSVLIVQSVQSTLWERKRVEPIGDQEGYSPKREHRFPTVKSADLPLSDWLVQTTHTNPSWHWLTQTQIAKGDYVYTNILHT